MNREAYEPRYNAQPGATLPVVRAGDPARGETAPRVVESMRWGLVPSFTRPDDRPDFFRMFNARSETLAEKPAFARLLARKRAVVLLSGFYEWRDEGGRGRDAVKQPYYLHLSDDATRPLRCAALYDRWRRTDEPEPVTTVTIITVPASGPIEWLHDRMPAVLATDEDVEAWLLVDDGEKSATKTNPSTSSRDELLRPYEGKDLRWYPVTTAMSKPDFEGPRCCEPTKREVERHAGSVAGLFAKVAAGTGTGTGTGMTGTSGTTGTTGTTVGSFPSPETSKRKNVHGGARASPSKRPKAWRSPGGGNRARDPTQRSVAGFFKPSG